MNRAGGRTNCHHHAPQRRDHALLHEPETINALARVGVEVQPIPRSNLPIALPLISRNGTT